MPPATTGAPCVTVIGAGPAGLMAAEVLAAGGAAVTVIDRMAAPGRKLLLAGRSGLNLTHSEPLERFLTRYRHAAPPLVDAIRAFPPDALRAWCAELGIATMVGSSGRVFPSTWKASPLLRAWLTRLAAAGVVFEGRTRWSGFADGDAHTLCCTRDGESAVRHADALVLALGGASWPGTGSDGSWPTLLRGIGVDVVELAAANAGWCVAWSAHLLRAHEGAALKHVAVCVGGRRERGDAVITRAGLQGTPVYALASLLDETRATATLDLRPDEPADVVAARLAHRRRGATVSRWLRDALHLSDAAVALVNEALARGAGQGARTDPDLMAQVVKAVPLAVTGIEPLDRAISSRGGVRWDALDDALRLRVAPHVGVAGEMLEWDAPTGGYLLQACLSTGAHAARGVLAHLMV